MKAACQEATIRSCLLDKSRLRILLAILLLIMLKHVYMVNQEPGVAVFKHAENTAPCVLPEIDPFDPKMMAFVKTPTPIVCADPAIVFVDENNRLQYNDTALALLKESNDTVSCEVTLITRNTDDFNNVSMPFVWKPPMNISEDFFGVKCKGRNGVLFDNYLTRIERKSRLFKKLHDALRDDEYSVLMFGMDSVSRSSAIRQLPKTYKYLTESLGGYDFKGYTKVADNTFVNFLPLLSGKFAYTDELPKIDYIKDWLDVLPVIWKNFSHHGCPTLFAEDYPNLNAFNMEKNGFLKPPTDHYMRPFWRQIKISTVFYNKLLDMRHQIQNSGFTIMGTSHMCTADKPNHVVVMDFVKQFMRTYKDVRKFAVTFLTELGHEYQNLLQLGDDDIASFLEWMKEEGYLNNTILITFSDHGLRFGDVQHLYVARIENRMPFLNIVLPASLKAKYAEAVKYMEANQKRLVSTFDLHATLRDILSGQYKTPSQFYVQNNIRGTSLFRPIPEGRSCADATINEDICPCHKETKVNVTNNPLATKIAEAVLKHINGQLTDHSECAKLNLSNVIELSKTEQGLKYQGTVHTKSWFRWKKFNTAEEREDIRHSIVFEATPGGGRFFATVDIINESSIKVQGHVDRVNKYGTQSRCIKEHSLKHICYCLK